MRTGIIIAAVLLLVMVLMWQFPYVMGNADRNAHILYLMLMIVLVAGGSGAVRRMSSTAAVRDAALWLAIMLVICLGYGYRHELQGTKLYGLLVPTAVQVTAEGALRVHAAENGHFYIEAEINGSAERFLVDTGASDIVLSPRAAYVAGFDVQSLNYSRAYETANGRVTAAPVMIDVLQVGPVTLRDVPASVNGAEMDESLLGIAFLKSFASYTVDGDTLTLYPQ